MLGEMDPGGLAEYVKCPARQAIALPEPYPFEEAACLPITFGTAWRMLVTHARVQPGEDVLVHGAVGGVGLAAIQIAKLAGARVFATASTAEKLERATELGADVAINYADDKDWDATVRRLTGKRGVDVIVETVGAATWERSIRALGKGGRLVTSGATSGPIGPTDIRYLFRREHTIQGSNGWTHNDLLTIVRARLRRKAASGHRPRATARAGRRRRAGDGAARGHRQGRHPAVGRTRPGPRHAVRRLTPGGRRTTFGAVDSAGWTTSGPSSRVPETDRMGVRAARTRGQSKAEPGATQVATARPGRAPNPQATPPPFSRPSHGRPPASATRRMPTSTGWTVTSSAWKRFRDPSPSDRSVRRSWSPGSCRVAAPCWTAARSTSTTPGRPPRSDDIRGSSAYPISAPCSRCRCYGMVPPSGSSSSGGRASGRSRRSRSSSSGPSPTRERSPSRTSVCARRSRHANRELTEGARAGDCDGRDPADHL